MFCFFTAVGFIVTLTIVYKIISGLLRFYRAHYTKANFDFKSKVTAVITGASDGIGKAYAFELARLGLKRLVLLGRNKEKLDVVCGEIKAAYPHVETRVILANFEETDMYERIEAEIADLHDVDILVNNVGCNINAHKKLEEIKPANFFKTVNINMVSTFMMSHIVVRKMIADKRRGAVINISSSAVNYPPRMILYAPSKRWMSSFSHSLRLQYQNDENGLIVQEVEPYFVTTKLARNLTGRWIVTPEKMARQSLLTLGHYSTTAGAVRHEILAWIMSMEPQWRADYLMQRGALRVVRAAERQMAAEQQQLAPKTETKKEN